MKNQLRAFLLEHGVGLHGGRRPLTRLIPAILEDDSSGLSTRMRQLLVWGYSRNGTTTMPPSDRADREIEGLPPPMRPAAFERRDVHVARRQ